jgi:ATP-dependent protease ClpP protease subunit
MRQKEKIMESRDQAKRRVIPVFGKLNHETIVKIMGEVIALTAEDPEKKISLVICSGGGMVEPGFAFIDMLKVQKISITTIGTGGVGSMAVMLFASGDRRLVTKHTVFFLHDFGFHPNKDERVSLNELRRKTDDFQIGQQWYADYIQEQTDGKFQASEVLRMMKEETNLYPDDLIRLGLAHEII